ncbi:MAG: LacI family transcriptional regulator [Bacteroidetes bacterium]|jgi:LacI family transcriptional regulator|nr:MAG: LacI family transcriptional regulator [Bacteroidota bacterium]
MQQSTLKKLSEVLGISISTVSRALKDHPDISENTKTKVKELATALEYEPNNYAVQLRTRQSNVLGILVPSIDNFFYDSFIAAVEEDARAHGYSVMIMQSRDKVQLETANLHLFRKNMVMGLFAAVSIETDDMAPFHKLEEFKIPVVFIDRVPEVEGYHKVCLADEDAARIAAEAIIEKKKKRVFALFGHPHLSISKIRHASLTEVFEKKSPRTKLTSVFLEGMAESERATLEVLKSKSKPDVIFCMGDMHLIGVMRAVHKLKLKVPDDIAVISISNGFMPTLYDPKITYVETSGFKLGKLAFVQMLSCLRNDVTPEQVMLSSVLVEGGSL